MSVYMLKQVPLKGTHKASQVDALVVLLQSKHEVNLERRAFRRPPNPSLGTAATTE